MLMTEWNTVELGKVQRTEGVAATLIELVERQMHIDGKTFDEAVAVLNLTDEEIKRYLPMRKANN